MIENYMKYDYLIVGTGLYASVFAYQAVQHGKSALMLEKRNHIGGNIYCQSLNGINIHQYGAHIFHTSDKEVWEFVNQFAEFNRYTNTPIADFHGKLYNLPFNMNTFYQMWGVKTPQEAKLIIDKQKKDVSIENPKNLEEQALSLVGKDIYYTLIKEYTEKQWGRSCTELPPFIIKRLLVRFTFDNNYFDDLYQGIPIGGYNTIINNLLTGIEIKTSVDFFENRSYWESQADKIVFTGKIDEFFDYCFGSLEYRTVTFETEILQTTNYQGNAVVNYTSHDVPYTRIIEHKHFEPQNPHFHQPQTIISKEYSSRWKPGAEPFYPINDDKNTNLYKRYKELADSKSDILFGGRLAEYKYYDMDDVIRRALDDGKKEFG